jgi:mRNA-degrading endonuclease RelE of RelBE toxin-antitoxin system
MKLAFKTSFERSLKKLPAEIQNDVKEAVIEMKRARSLSEISDMKKIISSDFYRKKIGDYRILLSWEKSTQTIVLCRIDSRKNFYKNLKLGG